MGVQARKSQTFSYSMHWPVTASTETLDAAIFSPDGRWFAVSSHSGMLGIWDVAADKPLFRSVEPLGYPLAFSPDGKLLATTSENGVVRLIDPPQVGLCMNSSDIRARWSAVFSHNGKGVVTSGAQTDEPTSVGRSSGKQQIALVPFSEVVDCRLSPDSEHVATISVDDSPYMAGGYR